MRAWSTSSTPSEDAIDVTACSRGLEHVGNVGTGEGHSRTSSDSL